MSVPKRATGANLKIRAGFAADQDAPEVPPADGEWYELRSFVANLSAQQPLETDPLLGAGRDAQEPVKGAFDVTGPMDPPIDQSEIGFWLRLMYGDAVNYSGGFAPEVGARGFIEFTRNPSDGDTITLNTVVWTFVTGPASGDQTQIGADLTATLDQLASDLNGVVDVLLSVATYSRDGNRLAIEHDTVDQTGNSYGLGSSNPLTMKPSGDTLKGGGFYRHVWHSGQAALPAAWIEVENTDLEAGSERFKVFSIVRGNDLGITIERTGVARATVNLIGVDQVKNTDSIAGTPVVLPRKLFSNFQALLLADDLSVNNVLSVELTHNNNLDPVGVIANEGKIQDSDPGQTELGLNVTTRLSNNAFKIAADSDQTMVTRVGFRDPANGAELEFKIEELHLPIPEEGADGPGGIEVTYQNIGATSQAAGRSTTVTLYNEVNRY